MVHIARHAPINAGSGTETVYVETRVPLSYAVPFHGSATATPGLLSASYADCPPGWPLVLQTSNLNVLPLTRPIAASGMVIVVENCAGATVVPARVGPQTLLVP